MKKAGRWRVERGAFRPRGVRWEPFEPGSTNRLWRGRGPSGDWLLKWYRHPLPGVHPEPEVGRFLWEHGFRGVPEFGARLDRVGAGGFETVAYIQRWVAGRAAWDVAVEAFRAGDCLARWARGLGRRVGALHAALAGADATAHPAFATVSCSVELHGSWVARVRSVCERLADALRSPPSGVPAAELEEARALWIGGEVGWRERLELLGSLGVSAICSRVHGDLHLGQILQGGGNSESAAPEEESEWWVVDFEGEPLRSLAERREPGLPLRDVAGMWRSFAYAAATAGVPAEKAVPPREAFMEGWAERMPLPEGDWRALFEALVWEKTVYEALYEIEHRPGWFWIPLRALA